MFTGTLLGLITLYYFIYIIDTYINYIYTYIYVSVYIYIHTINLKSHFPWLHDAYNLYNILLVFVYMNLV